MYISEQLIGEGNQCEEVSIITSCLGVHSEYTQVLRKVIITSFTITCTYVGLFSGGVHF